MREVFPITNGVFDFANGIGIGDHDELPEGYGVPESNTYKDSGEEMTPEEIDAVLNPKQELSELELLKQENEAMKDQLNMMADVLDFIIMNQS